MMKKALRKLSLNRETLSHLGESSLAHIAGGNQSLETFCLRCTVETGPPTREGC
jgi:hypothetical protein